MAYKKYGKIIDVELQYFLKVIIVLRVGIKIHPCIIIIIVITSTSVHISFGEYSYFHAIALTCKLQILQQCGQPTRAVSTALQPEVARP